MKKVMFVENGSVFSGAEIALLEFLKRQDFIAPTALILGNEARATEELKKAIGGENVFVAGLPLPLGLISRFLAMGLDINRYRRKLLSTSAFKQMLGRRHELIYLNNTTELIFAGGLNFGVPTIGHIHDMACPFRPAMRREAITACQKAAKIITVSNAAKQGLVRYGADPAKIEVIYNGVDILEGPDLNRLGKVHLAPKKAYAIGFVGSLIRRKGEDILTDGVIKFVRATGLMVELHFALQDYGQDLKKKVMRLLSGSPDIKVIDHGHVEHGDIYDFYKEMDLMVVPSRHEPLSTVILEALSVGVPVIASKVDGNRELIPDEDFLFDLNSPGSLADRLAEVRQMAPERLFEKITRLQGHLERNFSHASKLNKVRTIIESVLNGK